MNQYPIVFVERLNLKDMELFLFSNFFLEEKFLYIHYHVGGKRRKIRGEDILEE
jgi:hypothetical protein